MQGGPERSRESARLTATLLYTATLPASRTLSKFLCPTCADGHLGLCNSSLYMQCPSGETTCVQLDLVSEEGNVCVWCEHMCVSEPEFGAPLYRLRCVTKDQWLHLIEPQFSLLVNGSSGNTPHGVL